MLVVGQSLALQLVKIRYLGHSYDGKLAEMRVYHYRLRVGIAYYAYARVAGEFFEPVLKLGTEIRILKIVYRTLETLFSVIRGYTAAPGSQM